MTSLDTDQRAAVKVRGASVVAAGAGSGKTTVLAERYLSLIASGEADVSGILTLTFTRKAAAEMHSRIFALLRERRHEHARFRAAVDAFDTARIATLDSFAAEVARAGCAAYGLPPGFTTDEDSYLDLCRREALQFILHKADDPTMAWLTSDFGIDALRDEVLVPIARDYMKPGDPYDFSATWDLQQQALARELPRLLTQIDSELLMLTQTEGTQPTVSAAREIAAACLPLTDRALDELDHLLSMARSIKKTSSRKGDNGILASCVDALRPAVDSAREILVTQTSAAEITGLFELLEEFQHRVIAAKQDAAVLGFADVFALALRVLREQPDIRAHYRSNISHIMIDEFQDNNEGQKEFIELVAGSHADTRPADLFYVGDEKQSIYRFRGADVRVFKGLSSELSERGGSSLTLATNYRSDPALIAVFNSLFPSVFGHASEPYEAGFSSLKDRGGPSDSGSPVVEIYLKHKTRGAADSDSPEDLLSDREAEALFVADYIARAVRSGKARFEDFAILLRTTSVQQVFEQMLRRLDVPYQTESVRSIYLEAIANDVYALLQLCLFPEDRRAYATILRSPLCGMSDEGVLLLLGQAAPGFSDHEIPGEMSPLDRDRYERLCDMYQDIRGRAAYEPTADLLHRIWFDYGYRYEYLTDPANHTYLEYYDYLVAFSRQAGRENPAVFLDALRPNLGTAERLSDLAVLGRRSAGVQLMTVHKSKGLQFPIVIVAAADQTSNRQGGGACLYHSDEYGLSIAVGGVDTDAPRARSRANWFHTRGKEIDELHARAEMRRLLYVAMTRAEKMCVITGTAKSSPAENPPPEPGSEKSFLDLLHRGITSLADSSPLVSLGEIPAFTLTQSLGMTRRPVRPDTTALRKSYEQAPRHLPLFRQDWTAVALNEAFEESQVDDQTMSAPEALPALPVDDTLERYGLHAAFGTVTHWFAAALLGGDDLRDLPPNLARLFPDDARSNLMEAAKALARQAVAIVDVPAGSTVYSEKPFVLALPVDDRVLTVHGVIDLAIVGPDQVRVVDFKTDALRRSGAYRCQMDVYRRAAASLFDRQSVVVDTLYLRDMKTVRADAVEAAEYALAMRAYGQRPAGFATPASR